MALDNYRKRVEEALHLFISQMGEKNGLRDAVEYAVLNGGKRLRPILALMIADALDNGSDVMQSALSVEFFHTASLIADDLPCMDDDPLRRNLPSLHKVYGESVAILASYTLIAEGYGGIYRNGLLCPQADIGLCLEAATRCAGIAGATNGQFLDLNPPDYHLDTIKKIIYQKTVTLFEIAFVFGWIFGGGTREVLPKVKKCAYHLGMAFQIADDLLDREQDLQQESSINIAVACGEEEALILFEKEMGSLVFCLKELGLWTEGFQEIISFLRSYQEGVAVHPK